MFYFRKFTKIYFKSLNQATLKEYTRKYKWSCCEGKLYCSFKKFNSIQENAFCDLSHLNAISLACNKLVSIHKDAFRGLTHLKSLDLNCNKLQFISSRAFRNLVSLEHLNLSDNMLETLEVETFRGLISLKKLDLRFNKLESVDFLLNLSGTILEKVYIGANPVCVKRPEYVKNLLVSINPSCTIDVNKVCTIS